MGWTQYYNLLEKYNGDLSKASKEEMQVAFSGNPNDPESARKLAERKWEENHKNI